MDLSTVISDLKQHFETAEADAQKFLTGHLPELAGLADKAASNPALAAILSAVHLGEVPEFLQTIADLVTKADSAIAQSKATGAAEATAAAAVPPADPAAEPVPVA